MKRIAAICMAGMIFAGMSVRANDAGDLVFQADYPHKVRAELLYENVQRDLQVTSPTRVKGDLDADVFSVRLHTDLGHLARLDFDLGAMSAGSGSHKPVGGVGLRFLAFDHDAWRGGAFGQVRYARDLTDRLDLRDGRERVKYDLVEADAGFLVNYRLRVADQFRIVPYAGPVASIIRLSGDVRGPDGGSFRADEDRVLGVAVGLGFEFQGMNGIRFETRYFDDFSVSVAASFVF